MTLHLRLKIDCFTLHYNGNVLFHLLIILRSLPISLQNDIVAETGYMNQALNSKRMVSCKADKYAYKQSQKFYMYLNCTVDAK